MASGVTTNTLKRLVLDAAAIYKNYDEVDEEVLSATKGGSTFTVEQEIRLVEIDGVRGPVKGGRRIVSETARITAQLLEMTGDTLQLALAGSTKTTESTHEKITRTKANIEDSEYVTNIALVGEVQGSDEPFVCMIKNALGDGSFECSTEDQNEAAPEVQFTAHFEPSTVYEAPWEIRTPIMASSG